MDVAPRLPARFSGSPSDSACADTLLTDVLPEAVVQWRHSMGPVYQSVPHPSPNLISQQHFSQVTACDRCSPIVKDSIYLWHYDCVFAAKYWPRWAQCYRLLFHCLQSTPSVLDSNVLCNYDPFDAVESFAIIHNFNVMTSKISLCLHWEVVGFFYVHAFVHHEELKGCKSTGNIYMLFLSEMVLGAWLGVLNISKGKRI